MLVSSGLAKQHVIPMCMLLVRPHLLLFRMQKCSRHRRQYEKPTWCMCRYWSWVHRVQWLAWGNKNRLPTNAIISVQVLHSPRVGKMTPVEDGQQLEENIVGWNASKKQTRRGIYLSGTIIIPSKISMHNTDVQVAWLSSNERLTWEPASALPQSLIENSSSHQEVITTGYGVINHTLSLILQILHYQRHQS